MDLALGIRRSRSTILASLFVFLVCGPAHAQAGQLRALAIRYQEDLEQLKGYTWKSRTEVAVDGEVRERSLLHVRNAPPSLPSPTH